MEKFRKTNGGRQQEQCLCNFMLNYRYDNMEGCLLDRETIKSRFKLKVCSMPKSDRVLFVTKDIQYKQCIVYGTDADHF